MSAPSTAQFEARPNFGKMFVNMLCIYGECTNVSEADNGFSKKPEFFSSGCSITSRGVASALLGSVAATKVGAIGTGVVTGAAVASITGVGTGAGVASAICGAANLASGILTGPVGWIILGTSEEPLPGVYTFDCWKQVLTAWKTGSDRPSV
ncbi:unnamed protein product, partial [Didymodactylos carnosus]